LKNNQRLTVSLRADPNEKLR